MPLTEYQQEYAHQGLCRLEDTRVRPLEDQVVVRLEEEPNQTKSQLLYLPQGHTRQPVRFGTVVEVGPGDRKSKRLVAAKPNEDAHAEIRGFYEERWPMEVAVGDRVAFERRPWAQFSLDGVPHVVLHQEQQILGKIHSFCVGHYVKDCFHPIMDRYLVKIANLKATESKIILTGKQDDQIRIGMVWTRGTHYRQGTRMQPLSADENKSVLFSKGSYPEFSLYGEDFMVIREGDLLGILE